MAESETETSLVEPAALRAIVPLTMTPVDSMPQFALESMERFESLLSTQDIQELNDLIHGTEPEVERYAKSQELFRTKHKVAFDEIEGEILEALHKKFPKLRFQRLTEEENLAAFKMTRNSNPPESTEECGFNFFVDGLIANTEEFAELATVDTSPQ